MKICMIFMNSISHLKFIEEYRNCLKVGFKY